MRYESYWQRAARVPLGRRRFFGAAAAGGAGVVALTVVGCGGGRDKGSSATKSSSLLSDPADSTARAVPGGVLKDFQSGDLLHLDPFTSSPLSALPLCAVNL